MSKIEIKNKESKGILQMFDLEDKREEISRKMDDIFHSSTTAKEVCEKIVENFETNDEICVSMFIAGREIGKALIRMENAQQEGE